MKCPKCNFDVPESNKFCPECGEKMPEITTDTVSAEPQPEENVIIEKKPKNKKLKKILIISISAVVGCGLIFLILFLINPLCIFGHRNTHKEGQAATCTTNGYYNYICNDCGEIDWTYTEPAHDHMYYGYQATSCAYCGLKRNCEEAYLEHTFKNAICGEMNTCTVCGVQKKLEHSFVGIHCEYCNEMLYDISIEEPPITAHAYNYDNTIEKTCVITNISCGSYFNDLAIHFTVKSTYHEKGNNYSDKAEFGWKLYDSENTVVDSGTARSDGTIKVGEQSKGSFNIYDLSPNEEYRLEILNVG